MMEAYRVAVTLHLLGAAVWVGGHLVLCLAVLPRALRAGDPALVRDFEAGFERLGIPALALQVLTGLWLAYRWVPDVFTWFAPTTPQARLILTKLVLVVATIGLAVHARLRVIPALDRDNLRFLALHIVAVTILAVALLVTGVAIRTGAFL
jgi:putative copper export protein